MRIYISVLLCLALLGGCGTSPDPEPSPGEPAAPVIAVPSPSPTPASAPAPEPSPEQTPEPYTLDVSAFFELPESRVFFGEAGVYPLTNAFAWYNTVMKGPITFLDTELNPVELPFTPAEYAVVGGYNGAVMAYALMMPSDHPEYDGRDWVLMLADGTVPRSEDGKYIFMEDDTHNSTLFNFAGSAVVIIEHDGGAAEDEYGNYETDYRYGLYDLEERRVILPCEYVGMELGNSPFGRWDSMVYCCKDGFGYLMDGGGNILYEYGEVADPYFDQSVSFWDPWDRSFRFSSDGVFQSVTVFDDFFIAEREEEPRCVVFNQEGAELYRADNMEDAREFAGIPNPVYPTGGDYLNRRVGQFVLQYEDIDNIGSKPKAVSSAGGDLLLDNVYGIIGDVLGPGGGVFVYLGPETCVLLMPDGSAVPVPNAPVVGAVYNG
ncbi:MAG: hypothetical protein LBR72_00420 [Oscillospiraceae bacterium]|jgi:hypothetical protein|nr:hypothetical protein [Oscillospiraceae bacterium]